MDVVEFRRAALPEMDWVSGVDVLVNGVPLAEHARVVEEPFARREQDRRSRRKGLPSLAGSYACLTASVSAAHYLGKPEASWFDDGDTVLLGCDCGEWGCWPLTATVTVTPDRVTWSGFRTGHRDWDLGALGPFAFSRAQYERAVGLALG